MPLTVDPDLNSPLEVRFVLFSHFDSVAFSSHYLGFYFTRPSLCTVLILLLWIMSLQWTKVLGNPNTWVEDLPINHGKS